MKILIKNFKDILDEGLSVYQRGLLATILAVKEKDNPKMTLAKFKASVNMNEAKLPLALLHKKGYVKWSGYAAYKRSITNKALNPDILDIVEYMNKVWGRAFDAKSESTAKPIRARLERHSVQDIKLVIANRYLEWKDNEVMKKHLNPTTIFRPSKFEKYLEEARRTKKGESVVSIDKINLSDGDELNHTHIPNISKADFYLVRTYETRGFAPNLSLGTKKILGSNLIGLLQKQSRDPGLRKTFIYIYKTS